MGTTRKIWISSALPLTVAMLVLAPTAAFAGSPLLSGYGGPGAGEQSLIGSTLIGGSGGAGAGGSSGSGGSGGSSPSGSPGSSAGSAGGTSSTGAGSPGGSQAGRANAGSARGSSKGGAASSAPQNGRSPGADGGAASAYVYPTSQASIASAPLLSGISSADVLLLVGVLATLALVAVLTLRLSRLQS